MSHGAQLIVFLLLVIALPLIFLVLLTARKYLRMDKRRKLLRSYALKHGFSYDGRLKADINGPLSFYSYLRFSQDIRNLIKKKTRDHELWIFDHGFTFTYGGITHSIYVAHTVLYICCDNLDLPHFNLSPEKYIDGMESHDPVEFKAFPQFGDKYMLKSENESALREIFSNEVISFFSSKYSFSVEGKGNSLVIYKRDRLIDPERLEDLTKCGQEILNLLTNQ